MASPRPGPPAPTRRSPHAQRSGSCRARRGLWLAIGALALLAGLMAASGSASAQSGEVWVPEDYEHVIEGDSVPINVSFLTRDEQEDVRVSCDGCPDWEATVDFDEEKANCEITDARVDEEGAHQSQRVCQISFPEDFHHRHGGPTPVQTGEPSRATTYLIELGPNQERDSAEFEAHLSSASTCRPVDDASPANEDPPTGVAQRTDILMLSASGYPEGEPVTMRVRDGGDIFFERSFVSGGEHVAYHFRWQVPIDLSIGGTQREANIVVDSPSGGEKEPILLKPGVAQGRPIREPGFLDQRDEYNRTEGVEVWTLFRFFSAPPGCKDMAWDRDITRVTADHVGEEDLPSVVIRRHNDAPHPQPVQRVDTEETEFRPDVFTVNYTIPRDEETTEENASDPRYDVLFEKTQLADGNFIGEYNTSDYEVYPYEIEPEYEVLQDEVERLQTAELVLNLTYADGSPFTPNETDEDLEIAFGPEGEDPEFTFEANHREAGIWNVSQPLDFEYEPLDEYTWRIAGIQDTNGPPGERNYVPDTVTDIVDVVSARPRLDLTTVVDGTAVNATQRTERVHVSLDAEFLNGKPLTADNIDPSMGGIVLNINKRNQFDRVVDQERITLAHAGDGTWVESFRIGRSPSSAPVGDWDLQFEARDDRDPPNQNITEFPLRVDPADVSVTDTEAPPQLVDGGDIDFRFRLHYPDGSLATQRLLDESRGGRLDVALERVSRADQPPIVERELDPRPVSGGQAWELSINSTKIVPGNHYFNVTGEDVHGNPIGPHVSDLFTVLFNGEFRNSTTPICPSSNATEGCDVERGETVYVVFPGASGDKGMFGDRPEIRVHRQDASSGRWILFREDVWLSPQQFFNLTGRDVGENHVGRFVTDRSTPADTYRLVILGRNQDDTGFAGFSQTFNVTRVPVQRDVIQPLPETAKKTEEVTARFEHETGDVVDTTIAEGGPVTARNIEIDETGVGTFARWQPPSNFPTGPVSIQIEGRDLFGNPFEVELGPMELLPVEIEVQPDDTIPSQAPRGELTTFNVQMTYETGTSFRGEDGSPDVVVRDMDGQQVDEGRAVPRVGHWEIRWTPRADLPSGQYEVVVTGTDNAGNVVEDFVSDPIEVTAGTVTGDVPREPASNVRRGEAVSAQVTFPTAIAEGQATVTTGSTPIGDPEVTIDGSTVEMRFPTERSTELVDAFFRFTGTDAVGNNLTVQTERFSIRAQQLSIEWVQQPPAEIPNTAPVQASFVVQYPDGSYLRPDEGFAITGLFAVDRPLGEVETEPSEENPVVWQVEWEPPEDTRTDIPYHFSASARDQHRNDAPPVASRGFFVQNPVVPDYVPGPGAGPLVLSVALAALAALVRRR